MYALIRLYLADALAEFGNIEGACAAAATVSEATRSASARDRRDAP